MGVNMEEFVKYKPQDFNKKALRAQAKTFIKKYPNYAYILGSEELAELNKAMTKFLRFEANPRSQVRNRADVCEEIADALWAIELFIQRTGVDRSDIYRMMAYKIAKRQEYINNETIIQGLM